MSFVKVVEHGTLYANPLPHLRSRQAYFPNAAQLPDGTLAAACVVGEAFESVDQKTHLFLSRDGGRTWEPAGPLFPGSLGSKPTCDTAKITALPDGRLAALGYAFDRSDPERPLGNPATGGLLHSEAFFVTTTGKDPRSWTTPRVIPNTLGGPVEASGPLVALAGGQWATPIANFYDWEGRCAKGLQGRLLRSDDQGRTWNDRVVTLRFPGDRTTVWEQRLCELEPGHLLVISWNEDLANNRRLPNHVAFSKDNGLSFGPPVSTGIMGQTASAAYLGKGKVLALHCLRRDTDAPGVYACLVDVAKGGWQVLEQERVWAPALPIRADKTLADVFAFVKFGQPSAIRLADGDHLMVHWQIEDGQGKILWTRLRIEVPR